MATVVEDAGVFTRAGQPRTATKVPWQNYSDGKTYELVRGVDFTTKSVRGVADQARKYGDKVGREVEYKVVDNDTLRVRFPLNDETEVSDVEPDPFAVALTA